MKMINEKPFFFPGKSLSFLFNLVDLNSCGKGTIRPHLCSAYTVVPSWNAFPKYRKAALQGSHTPAPTDKSHMHKNSVREKKKKSAHTPRGRGSFK